MRWADLSVVSCGFVDLLSVSDKRTIHETTRSKPALQRPGDNYASDKLSMRGPLIPVCCKRL
jgi:hypothetical protein